ncbi:MAG: UDP-N-acetylglucosamine--N-acetylmuramyl-(pentapeptide) pyrophosphoryl-undecaprenol N-acetylglucosamine transferase [Acidimicrobiia bacterium]|nr:UDP-N-acetylglucosamine--N-acetylmuramyl-(pentapeptide) pyrophosphoryl-undecaprenol N-acetylglucosamine transferase [Acidimicrobiia bacterium]
MSAPSILIAAGGTGGHIFPGLALASALRRQEPAARLGFVGTRRGLEGRIIPDAGYPLHLVDMVPFAGARRALVPAAFARATWQARVLLRRQGATVAVGMGGYASIPLVAGARMAGVPSLVHESGAVPGRANLLAARFTGNVALAFERAASSFPGPTRVVGMPLSPEIEHFDRAAQRSAARAAFGVPDNAELLLVIGGSQGATTLNRAAVGLAARWRDRPGRHILLKTGAADLAGIEADVRAAGAAHVVRVVSFFERMDHAYAAADLALTRAGAGTVAELGATGLPAVLVPYPYAPHDHQAVNASVLVDVGAALMVRNGQATADNLGPLLEGLFADPERRTAMASAGHGVARPHAADELATWVLELAGAGARTAARR